jgi:hypothetical protein
MTTTTTRGLLWEMVAPAVRWPLRSPMRFFGSLFTVLLLLALVSRLSASPSTPTDAGVGEATPTSAGSSAYSGEANVPALVVASRFVTAWARPDAETESWWEGINSVGLDPALAQVLGQTDPRAIPASEVIGAAEMVEQTDSTSSVKVHTDGPTVLVSLARTPGSGWIVTNILPSDEDGAAEVPPGTAS